MLSFASQQIANIVPIKEDYPSLLATITLTITVFILIKVWIFSSTGSTKATKNNGDARSPPGPFSLPILGSVISMPTDPFHKGFVKMAEKFGNVFQIYIGQKPVVVLNGQDAIRQALARQAVDFAGRPNLPSMRLVVRTNQGSVAFSTFSESWKLHRKIADQVLRHFTSGRKALDVQQQVQFEASELVKYILKGKKYVVLDPQKALKLSVSNILAVFVLGRRHDLDDPKLGTFVDGNKDFTKAVSSSNLVDFMPWLRFFMPSVMRNLKELQVYFKQWFNEYVKEHEESYKPGNESDILYYLLSVADSMDAEELKQKQITREEIVSCIYDLFGAGFETVAATLTWAILYMMAYPDIQKKVQKEIDEVVGRDRLPTLADKERMPFTDAVLMEVSRHASVVPFAIPHATTRDTILRGGFDYAIPKDTTVFVNLYSVNHDGEAWDNPSEFRPERFLTDDQSTVDKEKSESIIMFGLGRRRCLGAEIAKIELFLYFTILMLKCRFENVEDQKLCFEGFGGLTLRPMDYLVKVSIRD